VVLALALLIVGAIALFGAVTSKPDAPGTTVSGTPGDPSRTQQTAAAPSGQPLGQHVLILKAKGPVKIYVATPGNTRTFINGTLYKGDIRTLDEKEMVVTVDPAQNVQVLVKGQDVSKGQNGQHSYSVP
jgi:hypothetical protein